MSGMKYGRREGMFPGRIRIRNILDKYERALRELQSDLCDQVQAGDITAEQANEWANEKADQWAAEADAEILAVGGVR